MNELVPFQRAGVSERLPAFLTDGRVLAGVDLLMSGQVVARTEATMALLTKVRLRFPVVALPRNCRQGWKPPAGKERFADGSGRCRRAHGHHRCDDWLHLHPVHLIHLSLAVLLPVRGLFLPPFSCNRNNEMTVDLKGHQVVETMAFPRIGYAMIIAKTQLYFFVQ